MADRRHDLSLLGLFSLIDAIVGQPLDAILEAVCLPEDIAAAIRGEPGLMTDCIGGALGLLSFWCVLYLKKKSPVKATAENSQSIEQHSVMM